jgi:type IV pilus assembly protein PilO
MGMRGAMVVGIVLGMPVASWILVFRPQNQNIAREREDLQYKESVLAKVREANTRNQDLQKLNEDLESNIRAIVARLPSDKEIDDVVRQVSDLAVKAGLEPPSIKSSRQIPAAMYMEQPLEMEITGDLSGFREFVASIEKMPRITRIPDLKLTGVDKQGAELKAEFTLSIYFQDSAQKETQQ